MNNIIMKKKEIEGLLSDDDRVFLDELYEMYKKSINASKIINAAINEEDIRNAKNDLTENSKLIGDVLEKFLQKEKHIHVYSFETPSAMHPVASRIISKLRSVDTKKGEFVYYIQRAYELMFSYIFCQGNLDKKRSLICKTPVTEPSVQYACHRIIDIDDKINNTVICVMLRGALLPSMIVGKEIEEYSSNGFVSPFALFRIKRNDEKSEKDMEYIMDLDRSFFDIKDIEGKDLIFADPMNATGGSLITILKFLERNNIKIKSVKFINIISALKGCLTISRFPSSFPIDIYTLWLDPILNPKAYILPGLGDAGDRINGFDVANKSRNIIQLIADYGSEMTNLYRNQVREIERIVLERGEH